MNVDIDTQVVVSLPESPSILCSATKLSENQDDGQKTSDVVLELKEIPYADCDIKNDDPHETDGLLDSEGACALIEGNPVEIGKDEADLSQLCHELKKKRGSTIDVVNCDDTTESSSDSGSVDQFSLKGLTGGHLINPKNDDAEEATIEIEEDSEMFDFREIAAGAMRHAEELVRRMMLTVSWTICHFHALPKWLQDNDFIWQGYRPPLPSFWDCIKSIFSIHTETGNIWTHMLGCIAFLGVGAFFLSCSEEEIRNEDKVVFSAFFTGACVCLGLSTCFHTFLCHSEWAGQLFSKLDYVGIALLIMGSFVPWLYYSFYCDFWPRIVYVCVEIVLGLSSIIISLWPRFGEPRYRFLRAGVFLSFGLSGVIPAVHYSVQEGWIKALNQASLGWLILMGLLYIIGTMFYALRIPERFFPGKFDIWFQSHQIFHVFVVAAAFVHYHGISEMAMHRLTIGECPPLVSDFRI
ncbi:adiponectin receptor protein-like [Daphnia pulex]|uniref:adiponectin receptor protein-like n=1 Tax=Daphnia pulex TaxID=6669 RepID=UPI001EDEACAC|nr:adiponectin receptor protein-like [Daphnia pulex]